MADISDIYLLKAEESLAGAESELVNGRYNNCANRAYYAVFQAAVAALLRAGMTAQGSRRQWSHAYVPAQFDGTLINRRKLYSTELRNTISRAYLLRKVADYQSVLVSETEALRGLRRARRFVAEIQMRLGERQ